MNFTTSYDVKLLNWAQLSTNNNGDEERMYVLLQMVVNHIYHPQYVLFTPRGEKYLEHSVIRS